MYLYMYMYLFVLLTVEYMSNHGNTVVMFGMFLLVFSLL